MEQSTSRINWIDTAKLIGIYLMILGHVEMYGQGTLTVESLIYAFHMPLFFFLSGLVDKQKELKETIIKSFRQLVIPYLCWYLINYLWWLIIAFYRHPEMYERTVNDAVFKPLLGMILAVGHDTSFSTMAYVQLWFIIALFWCKIASSFISNCTAYAKLLFVVGTIVVSLVLSNVGIHLPFSIGSACMAFPIYYLGVFVKDKVGDISIPNIAVWKKAIVVVVAFGLILVTTYFNGKVDIANVIFGNNPLLYFVGAILGIIMICLLAQILPPLNKFFSVLARNTLVILGVNDILGLIMLKAFYVIVLGRTGHTGTESYEPWQAMIFSALVLVICYIPCLLISKYLPILAGQKRKISKNE